MKIKNYLCQTALRSPTIQTWRLGALNRLIFISTEHDAQNETNIIAITNFLIVIMLVIKKNEQTGSTLDPVAQKLCGYRFSLSWSTTLDGLTVRDLSCLNG